MVIRPVRADESSKLRELRLRALDDAPAAFSTSFAEAESRPMAFWNDWAADGLGQHTFVAEDDTEWVGMATGTALTPDCVEVIQMWVHPGWRRKRLATALLDEVAAWAADRGAATLALSVGRANLPAIALYERCGFVTIDDATQATSVRMSRRTAQVR